MKEDFTITNVITKYTIELELAYQKFRATVTITKEEDPEIRDIDLILTTPIGKEYINLPFDSESYNFVYHYLLPYLHKLIVK